MILYSRHIIHPQTFTCLRLFGCFLIKTLSPFIDIIGTAVTSRTFASVGSAHARWGTELHWQLLVQTIHDICPFAVNKYKQNKYRIFFSYLFLLQLATLVKKKKKKYLNYPVFYLFLFFWYGCQYINLTSSSIKLSHFIWPKVSRFSVILMTWLKEWFFILII